jgi:hypothetical protein
VWLLSLLMSEAKVVVVGEEAGIVSGAVMGLLALLHPLSWVSPLIPLLPTKYLEFVESPVPLLTGILLGSEGGQAGDQARTILDRCDDEHCGGVTAVLDTCSSEVFLAPSSAPLVPGLLMPGAAELVEMLAGGQVAAQTMRRLVDGGQAQGGQALYRATSARRAEADTLRGLVAAHIEGLVERAGVKEEIKAEVSETQRSSRPLNTRRSMLIDVGRESDLLSRGGRRRNAMTKTVTASLSPLVDPKRKLLLLSRASLESDAEAFMDRLLLTQIFAERHQGGYEKGSEGEEDPELDLIGRELGSLRDTLSSRRHSHASNEQLEEEEAVEASDLVALPPPVTYKPRPRRGSPTFSPTRGGTLMAHSRRESIRLRKESGPLMSFKYHTLS